MFESNYLFDKLSCHSCHSSPLWISQTAVLILLGAGLWLLNSVKEKVQNLYWFYGFMPVAGNTRCLFQQNIKFCAERTFWIDLNQQNEFVAPLLCSYSIFDFAVVKRNYAMESQESKSSGSNILLCMFDNGFVSHSPFEVLSTWEIFQITGNFSYHNSTKS